MIENKKSNMIQILDFVLFMGVVGYFFQILMHTSEIFTKYKENTEIFCSLENSCLGVVFIGFLIGMFIMQLYIVLLYKKRKQNFRLWFTVFFSFGVLSELAIYINGSIMSSPVRLAFHSVFLFIFTMYLFYSKEGKALFSK